MAGRELNANRSIIDTNNGETYRIPFWPSVYLTRPKWLALILLAIIALAAAIITMLQPPFLNELGGWAAFIPYVSVALVAWWPCREVLAWLRTGVVTSGVVGAAVAAGYLLLRAPVEATLVLGAITLSAAIAAVLREKVIQPLLVWQKIAADAEVDSTDKSICEEATALSEKTMTSVANGQLLLQRFLAIWSLVCSVGAVVVGLIWPLIWGSAAAPALAAGLALLALTLPGNGQAAATSHYYAAVGACLRRQIIPSDIRVLERLARLQVLAVVDGCTSDNERYTLDDVLAVRPQVCSPIQVLAVAAAVANQVSSNHPVRLAICRAANQKRLKLPVAQQGREDVLGISASVEGHRCLVGSGEFLRKYGVMIDAAASLVAALEKRECEPVYVVAENYILGVIGIAGAQSPHNRTRSRLQRMGIKWFDIIEEQDGQFVMQHPGGTAVSLLAGQEVRTLRSWLGQRCVIGVAGTVTTADALLANADVSISLGPLAGAPSYNQQLLMLQAELVDIPAVVAMSKRMRRLVTRWGIGAMLLRLALTVLAFMGYLHAVGVVLIDCVFWGVLSISALRLNRR